MNNIEIRTITCNEGILEYQLTRKQVKNINLRIKRDGQVFVSANKMVPVTFLDDFVKTNQASIFRVRRQYEEYNKNASVEPKQYVAGEIFNILGKCFYLKVVEDIKESVSVDGTFLVLCVKNANDLKRKEKRVNDWLKQLQIDTFQKVAMGIYPLFNKYDVTYPQIRIRRMRSRWGSCQPRKGIITLNSQLIEAPLGCIEYVVLHEFSHFVHPNHSKQFYDFVEMFMPDWKERKQMLEKNIL